MLQELSCHDLNCARKGWHMPRRSAQSQPSSALLRALQKRASRQFTGNIVCFCPEEANDCTFVTPMFLSSVEHPAPRRAWMRLGVARDASIYT